MENKVVPLTLRRRLALEAARLQQDNLERLHPLRQLFWECTLRCNLRCRHCGSDCRVEAVKDMPREDFMRVLDSIKAHGMDPHKVFVILSGGEPLMRPDLEECGAEIHAKGFPWGIVTNALALTPRRFDALVRGGLASMAISLDGLEDDHDWMRGHAGSFRMVDQAIAMLEATPHVVYDLVTCVNRRNYAHLPQIRDYLLSRGVRRWRIFTVFPVGRAAHDPQMRLSGEEFRGVFDFIRQTRAEGRIRVDYGCEGFLGNYEGEVRNHLYTCQAGLTVGSVRVDGTVSGCTSIRARFDQGNIYEDDFVDIWEQRFQPFRDRRWARRDECRDCRYFRYCRGGGMHLHDDDGRLLLCHLHRLQETEA